jgi:elongation factor P hydroxylase
VTTELSDIFRACFFASHQTHLVGGAKEPLYLPAPDGGGEHCIQYRQDFFASALHEVAHWCIAGPERRLMVDYGYWYAADGRDEPQQRNFEQVEIKPQAIEWHFALACQRPFRISNDNLSLQPDTSGSFVRAVCAQAGNYAAAGLPPRAQQFRDALAAGFGGEVAPGPESFTVEGV